MLPSGQLPVQTRFGDGDIAVRAAVCRDRGGGDAKQRKKAPDPAARIWPRTLRRQAPSAEAAS
jgi:hypothetical protein